MQQREDVQNKTRVAPLLLPEAGVPITSRASLANKLGERVDFLRGFLRHPGQVGSAIPSSVWLEQRLVNTTRVAKARVVIELGPGTGGTTRALLAAMPPAAQLLAIELEPAFQAHLIYSIRDARLTAHLGSAEQVIQILNAYRLPAPDVIISGIPFSTMPTDVAERIAAAIAAALAPAGRFVAYQVRDHVARYVTPHLGTPQQQREWINIPPVRVFTWTKGALQL
jgi:phospholipid N-methyltransferase